jgi:hypothetical protein
VDNATTLADLLAQIENLAELDDSALAALEADLLAAQDDLLDGAVTDDVLAEAEQATAGVEAVRAEQASRETAAAERADRAQALRDRVRDAEDPEPDGDPATEPDAEGAEPPAAEPEPEAEPIAAALVTPPTGRLPARTGRVASRRVAQPGPQATGQRGFQEWGLVAAANAPGIQAGTPITTWDQLATLFATAFRTITGPGLLGPRAAVPLVRAGRGALAEYGQPRYLDSNAEANQRKIDSVVSPEALVASGGICGPSTVVYDMPVVGSTARPVRDGALARFGADRGGVRTLTPPVLSDVTGAVGIWTNQDDIDAGSNDGSPTDTVKPCLVIDCPDDTETLVQAITQCFRTGNFRQRFFPEQVEAVMRLVAVAAARVAETALLQAIKADCTAVTTARLLGTSRDVLAYLDQAVSAHRDRWRLDDSERLRFVAHRMLRDMMRADIARSLPGDPATNFVVADSQIASWFAARGVNVTWAMEASSNAGHFGAQAAGPLVKWPTAVECYLYPEGSFLFLDGGSLDLGLIRDSSLASTNDLMFFSETTEGVHFVGPEALLVTMTLCPDGTVSGTADIDPCA